VSTTAARRKTDVTLMTSVATRPPAHLAAAVERPYDVWLLFSMMSLLGIGIVMIYSASIGVADMRFDDPNRFLRGHLRHVGVAMLAFIAATLFNYQQYRRHVYRILGVSVVLLVLTVAGLGINRGNSTRWIGFGFMEFQPSELAKLAFVIYLAYSLEKKLSDMRTFAIGFLPHLLVCMGLMLLCLMQPDLGTCILLGIVMLAMLYVGGTKIGFLVGIFFAAVPVVAQYIALSSNRMGRVLSWLDPWQDRFDTGFQTVNALTSLGSGGIWGRGLGAGRQKMGFLTQGWTDFIFSSIGEELGLVGCSVVVVLFAVFCWRGFRAAWKAPDRFGRYLAFGVTALIGSQAAFNMAVAVGLLPTKGLNLPFVSGGGSSLVVTCFAAGILLNISRFAEAPSTWEPLTVERKPKRQDQAKAMKKAKRKADDKEQKRKTKKPVSQSDRGVVPFPRPRKGGK
jgi:cell division protein FtsW